MKPICLVVFICFVTFNSFGQCNPPLLKNPSFESPVVSRTTYITIPIQGGDFGWSATHGFIEMWKTNAADGTQFIELNNASNMRIGGAPNVYKLWQDIDTSPGQVLTISFAHKSQGRATDECKLQIGDITAPATCVTASDNTLTWKTYTCQYTVPSGQSRTRIQFIGTPGAASNIEGNHLDHIMITSNEGTTSNVKAKCTSDVVNLPPASTSIWIAAPTNPSPTVIASGKVSGFAITGTYTYTLFTGACTNTIIIDVLDQNSSIPTVASNSPVLVGGQLSLTTTNVGGLLYTWSGPNGYISHNQNASISNVNTTMSGLYTLVTTSAIGGCQSPPATTPVYINKSVSITANSPCAGSSLSLTTSINSTSYLWETPDGQTSTLQNLIRDPATTIMSGSYTLTALIGAVSVSQVIDVSVFDSPPTPVIIANALVLCSGDPLSLLVTPVPKATYSWVGPQGALAETSNRLQIPNTDYFMSGSYTVTLTSADGCTSPPAAINITIINIAVEPQVASNSPICEGVSLKLSTDVKIPKAHYLWQGQGYTSDEQNSIVENTIPAMSGAVTLSIATGISCSYAPMKINVKVNENPKVDTVEPDLIISQRDSKKLMATASGVSLTFRWDPIIYLDDPTILNPTIIRPKSNTVYKLTATSAFGCTTFGEVSIIVPFVVPNTFTPNGDGINDVWEIEGITNYPNATVHIFNRWGRVIYISSRGYDPPWGGTDPNNVDLPTATYYYVIDLKNGSPLVSGYVALIR